METTLSSSVSSIKIPSFYPPSHRFLLHYHFKASNNSSHRQNRPHPHPVHSYSSTNNKPIDSIVPPLSPTPTITTHFTSTPSTPLKSQSSSDTHSVDRSPSTVLHHRAATGYAAALIEISKLNNSLGLVHRGVRCLAKWLNNERIRAFLSDPFADDGEKGKIVKVLADEGKLNKHLANLLRVLVERGKVGILGEVLAEFERIYDELCWG